MNNRMTTNPAAIRSRKALAVAFVELLLKQPMERITIEEITTRAGLSRQTFYTNFSKKEDILTHSLNELISMLRAEVEELPGTLEELLPVYFKFWSGHQKFLSVLFDQQLSYLFAMENAALFQETFYSYALRAAASPEELPYVSNYLAGLTFQMIRTWQQNGWRETYGRITEISCRLLRGGCVL